MSASWEFPFEVGALIRKQALFQFRSGASQLGLTFSIIADDGGWLSTSYLARVEGPDEAVRAFRKACIEYIDRLGAS